MMENHYVPIDMASSNLFVVSGVPSQTTPNSLMEFGSFDRNNQSQALSGHPVISDLQSGSVNDLHANIQMTERAGVFDSDALPALLGRNIVGQASPCSLNPTNNTGFQQQFMSGTPISGSSLATLLALRSDVQEDLNNLSIYSPPTFPPQALRNYDCSDTANPTLDTHVYYCYGEGQDKFPNTSEVTGKTLLSPGFESYSSIGNMDLIGWIPSNGVNVDVDNPYGSCKYNNERSLSLATSQPSIISGTSITDHCSVVRCSEMTRGCLERTRLGSEQTSCCGKELSLSFSSNRTTQFSQVRSGSRYLDVIQEILAQIASYSLQNLGHKRFSTGGIRGGESAPFSSSFSFEGGKPFMGYDEYPDANSMLEIEMEPAARRLAVEVKKNQLLSILQVVDDRYNQCLDEIHTVVSAFHAATELDPQVHARFALQTISSLYKSLRERISNQILAMGAHFDSESMVEKGVSFETSFFQKQWALQQLKRKDDQIWRPQRGLPERSVSVLRAWMFQNFLHPYPKDAEKHLLAVKSGLTRSQVSNWFINARVRLWKPMIEEMYSEMSRRKALGFNNSM
ncbi:hypothetical protein HS088_TW23G00907 [Tripterygium wilfordii]|uniref:Homeobox domain-containing protein n=1 Tax=Tripterygium wilfordii TaxID=458696 RepID=A0A7J7BX95_TRIWF|nr:homeobox protein ATH1-like [Tripterygium wilfordii]XP_038695806.1 homeobox protein ATH1-like [Tripterygium wilfordii]XP_038695807.1 homeobox protein ATH1-like [Tripterygium wilfordii]KAF5726166.1 hypothetical protein HS088_TW23G00907 [Tripterygium wilfordii]